MWHKKKQAIEQAARLIREATHTTAFTGAGISVESGIPPFRGPNGLWSKIDPGFLDIGYFHDNPRESWRLIKEIFYDFFGQSKPNAAHLALHELEQMGFLETVITQNIDNLHQQAGSRHVVEFHGTSGRLICESCGRSFQVNADLLGRLPPVCAGCSGILKPDFVFFGEPIPETALSRSLEEAMQADLFILIGTTGEIMPASMIPVVAKKNGTTIIEINTTESNYTGTVTDIFLKGKATEMMTAISEAVRES